ncbi:hypothetical protein [Bacteriophage sp.]|nr:hypothetical protein [Bacteriophage sp.]
MRTNAKCMITGCGLYFDDTQESFHGDLFSLGDSWVFNAVTGRDGEAMETSDWGDQHSGKKSLIARASLPHFERRGVFTFPKTSAHLNQAAKDYIGEVPI